MLIVGLVRGDGPHEDLCPAEFRELTVQRTDSEGRRLTESMGAVVLMPQANTGPFFGDLSNYHEGVSMIAEATAGSPSVATARRTVLDGVPLTCTFNLFNVSGNSAEPIPHASVYTWHADAIGHYSNTNLRQNDENTVGQLWLRAKTMADENGQAVVHTIFPGWYTDPNRTSHMHVRVSLPGMEKTFVSTSQLVFDITQIGPKLKERYPYSENPDAQTYYPTDFVWLKIDKSVRDRVIPELEGDLETGLRFTYNLGIDLSDIEDFRIVGVNDGEGEWWKKGLPNPRYSGSSNGGGRTLLL